MLMKMPGVNSKNVTSIMNHVTSLADLTTWSQTRLAEILGSDANARALHGFLHRKYDPTKGGGGGVGSAVEKGGVKGGKGDGRVRKPVFYGKKKR